MMATAAMPAAGNMFVFLSDIAALSDARLERYACWLGESELARYRRFVRTERRRQFIAGRALLRLGLERLVGAPPGAVALRERPGQAPELLAPASDGVWFSVSHSRTWVGCALGAAGAIGFDIEHIDATRDVLALAGQALGAAAVSELDALAGEERIAAFYRMWCAYEARIKLGQESRVVHPYMLPGLAGALACAQDAGTPPTIEFIDLGKD